MNLLPATEKENIKKGLKIRSVIMGLFLAAISFLLGFIILLPSYFLTIGNFSRTGEESHSLKAKNDSSIAAMLSLPEEISSKLRFLQANTNDISVAESFGKVINFLPEEVALNSISYSRNQTYNEKNGDLISVSGTALNRDSLVTFSNLLKESKLFSAVDVPVSSLTKDKNLPFSIKIFIESKNE